MAAFHLYQEGRADYTPTKKSLDGSDYGEKLTFVGDAKNPIWIGKRKEVQELFSAEFWELYDVWAKWHIGLGLPWEEQWHLADPVKIEALAGFERLYRSKWSGDAVMLRYMEHVLESLGVMNKNMAQGFKNMGKLLRGKR